MTEDKPAKALAKKFAQLLDADNNPYLALNMHKVKKARLDNATLGSADVCSFLHETLDVTPLATGRFTTDLTPRDDVLLAVLSLVLLLLIEATLSAVLLRTRSDRTLSNFAFSVKHFVDLARDFRFAHLIRGSAASTSSRSSTRPRRPAAALSRIFRRPRRPINPKLLFTATVLLAATFGLEVLVLYFSSPSLRQVTTATASLQLKPIINPDWASIRDSLTASSTSRPCTTITLQNVDQDQTQISACLTSNLSAEHDPTFTPATNSVNVTVTSDVHEFGVEHQLKIGDIAAKYSARAYFSLFDRKTRLMRARKQLHNKKIQAEVMHHQLIAYLFNAYVKDTNDTDMNIGRLKDIEFEFDAGDGPAVDIIQLNGEERFRRAISVRYVTTFEDIVPQGEAAMVFAQQFFKGSIALEVTGPDFNDLIMSSGNTQGNETIMWNEESRTLNWLTLLIVVIVALVGFAILRYFLQPVGTAEIAMVSVIGAADGNVALAEGVRKNFGIAKATTLDSDTSDDGSFLPQWHFARDKDKFSDDLSLDVPRREESKGTESLLQLPF